MVALATVSGESEELRQRGRQGSAAQHGCSPLLCDREAWTTSESNYTSNRSGLQCRGHFVIATVITTLNNIKFETSYNYVCAGRTAPTTLTEAHRRVSSGGSATWVFPPTCALTLLWLWCTSFFSSAYLRREDDVFKLAKVAVVYIL